MRIDRRSSRALRMAVYLLVSPAALHASADPPGADSLAIRATLERYFEGQATGQQAPFRAAFRPEAHMYGVRDGALRDVPIEQYISGASGRPAADEAKRRRTIDRIDIAGTVAVARLTLDYPTVRFTDFMTLLKIDGEWRIIAKVYHADPVARTP